MPTIKGHLATESHPAEDHHWQFSPECLDSLAEQAKGLPVTVNFSGNPIGTVTAAERDDDGVLLTMTLSEMPDGETPSPAFIASGEEWNEDFSERVIGGVDLKGISFTED